MKGLASESIQLSPDLLTVQGVPLSIPIVSVLQVVPGPVFNGAYLVVAWPVVGV